MVKKQTKFLIVLLYIAVTLIGLEIAIRNPENLLIVIGGFLIVIGVLTMLVAYTIHTVLKKYADKEREYMENIANSINAMVILWYDDFKHVKVNTVFTKKFGYSSEEMLDMDTLKQILPPDAFAVSLQAIVNNRDEEFIATAKDGSKIHTIWNTSLMKTIYVNERQTCLMLSIGLDLTENSALREEILKYSKDLRDSEDKFSMSMEFSEIGLILRDENSFYVSDQFKKMVVYDEKDGETVADTLNKSVHPKDKHVINSVIKDMGDVDDKDYNRIRSVELRLLRQDNLYHWFQFRYKVTPDSDFKKARIGGAVIDVTNDREKDQLIEQMAYIDEVTEIYNRNRFIMLGEEIYNTSYKEMGFDHWIIVFDIDNFHIINDTCGYLSGNKLLKEFARVLLFALIDEGICARIGGDNFAVIIEVGDDEQRPVKLINTVQKNLSKLAIDNFSTQNLSCSAGYSKMSNGSKNFIQGLDHAEFSLSLSDGKRGDIIQYDEMIHTKILQSTELEKELAKAIDHNDLVLYYQPKINLANGELIGMEALIRWIKPDGSIIPPGQFIPIAENSLLITKISE